MYGVYPYWYRSSFHPVWTTDQTQALELIRQSVQGERNDELFYDELIRLAPMKEQATIIKSIRDDERGHNRMFRGIYNALTGHEVSGTSDEQYGKVTSYEEGLQRALLGELSAVEKYRKIWFGLPDSIYRDTVMGIILDEQKHASLYNYLFTLSRTNNK
ncbi:ferritin-like domain-containing protein [Paenibacillus sp. LMG 31456]|uniref:Ferritin-like domain-containing protein n=1 Tax=Paenibacillus foliorum TaxID=2654974 RepID=A0A972JZ39_9BACL|nr:ferritin-like domain-containing protein [Paenibacillus foliorum]NOU92350.1 ferritin-like domain-containing protein [Paenibacillus foliorum]